VLEDEQMAARLAETASDVALSRYSLEACMEATESVYLSIVEGESSR